MSKKSASQLESEIRTAIQGMSLRQTGLWTKLRNELEHNCDGHPGELRRLGSALSADDIAKLAKSRANKVAPLLKSLCEVSVGKVALLGRSADGVWHSPVVAKLIEERRRKARNMRDSRSGASKKRIRTKRVVTLPPKGGNMGGNIPPGSPPSSSPPITPSYSNPHSDTPSSPKGDVGDLAHAGTPHAESDPEFWDLAPPSIRVPKVRQAWADWLQHRRERKPKVNPTSAKQQLRKLAAMGPARAVSAIQHSIANGWQGIYEPRNGHVNAEPAEAEAVPRKQWTETELDELFAKMAPAKEAGA